MPEFIIVIAIVELFLLGVRFITSWVKDSNDTAGFIGLMTAIIFSSILFWYILALTTKNNSLPILIDNQPIINIDQYQFVYDKDSGKVINLTQKYNKMYRCKTVDFLTYPKLSYGILLFRDNYEIKEHFEDSVEKNIQ